MADLTAQRRLVKSPPELWAELSEPEHLARHLDPFGEIRITRLEPEHTVAWEGEGASGTVSIEGSGWGTRVILTATLPETAPEEPVTEELAVVEPAASAAPDPAIEESGEPAAPRPGFLARLRARWRASIPDVPEPAPEAAEPAREDPEPAPEAAEPAPEDHEPAPEAPEATAAPPPDPGPAPALPQDRAQAALDQVLDALGAAHHRPFSRP